MKKQKEKPVVFLEGERLYLRPVSINDAEAFCRFANDPDVRRYVSNTYPISLEEEKEWIEKQTKQDIHNVLFCVCLKENDTLLGVMSLHKIDYVNRTAETGTFFGEKSQWNKGYATEAKMLVLEYAFLTLNLRKVCSSAIEKNKGSIKHNLKCGYKIYGKRKKHIYRDGKYYDDILLHVFKKDWLNLKK